MSLYVFGKAVPNGAVDSRQFSQDYPSMRFDSFDPEDVAVLDAQEKISEAGFYFSISHRPDVDATRLWNDAMVLARQRQPIINTVLGGHVYRLLTDRRLRAVGVAFVDGGVETILEGTPTQCWLWFEERIDRPWDAIDNPLLIWTHKVSGIRGTTI